MFQDATIFQTMAFCRARTPRARLEQLILRRGDEVVAAALARVVSIPFAATSIAYVLWGPLCQREGAECDRTALEFALKILRDEYVGRRGFGLRIALLPSGGGDDTEEASVLLERGYRPVARQPKRHTIIIDLDQSLDQLRRGLDQKWRNQLNRAERNKLTVSEGEDDSHFEMFLTVYREMLARKRLAEPGDIRSFRRAQAGLPDRFKLRAFVALEEGRPSAGAICSAIGDRGVYAFGATGDSGMRSKASYLLQWRIVEWLKERHCRWYDLHGSNAVTNPGVYEFKMGLCGKNGREIAIPGHFEASEGRRMRLLMTALDRANSSYKGLKRLYEKLRGFQG